MDNLKYAFAGVVLLVAVNLIFLDLFIVVSPNKSGSAASVIVQSATPSPSNQFCPAACLTKLQEFATVSSALTAAQPTATPIPTKAATKTTPSVKEFFVPFGSGSGQGTDWEDIPGLLASIDTANYGQLKTVTFEASLRIPTGNETAYARLFNVTDKHPVWFSDVSLEGGTPQLVTSSPVQLDTGNKTYQVQLKTSLGSLTFIDQARLRIEVW